MSLPPRNCPTVLLDDLPVSQDAFRHKRISEAMAAMISSEPGGRAIALSGPWGSGKSTVIRILSDLLGTVSNDSKVIIFDAWSHQGDPLRRGFLESAIRGLEPWLSNRKYWTEQIEVLARRRSTTSTHTKPELSTLGAFGAISILLSPLGYQLYNFSIKDPHNIDLKHAVSYLLMGASPLIVAAILVVQGLWQFLRGHRRGLPELIYTSSQNKTTTESSKTPDPTSIEFEVAYRELMKEAVGKSAKRVVFVIDNLDRLESEDAKSVWSTLKLFFDPSLREEPWFENVWIIVPFDEMAIRANSKEGLAAITQGHFIEKTFQAYFRVPPSLLTNWEEYLSDQLRIAFPAHADQSEIKDVFRIYDRLRPNLDESPTPRQIKLFVNRLGSLHRQWQHEIPIPTQAIFSLALDCFGAGFLAQLQGGFVNESIPSLLTEKLTPDWQRDLAALYFNVPVDSAFQALLFAPIAEALHTGDHLALQNLERSSGFAQVLEKVFDSRYSLSVTIDQKLLVTAALSMQSVITVDHPYTWAQSAIVANFKKVQRWRPLDARTAGAIAWVSAQNSYPPRLLQVLFSSLTKEANSPITGETYLDWAHAVSLILPSFINSPGFSFPDNLYVDLQPPEYLLFVSALRKVKAVGLLEYLRPVPPGGTIVQEVTKIAQSSRWDRSDTYILLDLSKTFPMWDWSPLGHALVERIGGSFSSIDDIKPNVKALQGLIDRGVRLEDGDPDLLNSESGLRYFMGLVRESQPGIASTLGGLLFFSSSSFEQVATQRRSSYYSPPTPEEMEANAGRAELLEVFAGPKSNGLTVGSARVASRLYTAKEWRVSSAQPGRRSFVAHIIEAAIANQTLDEKMSANELLDGFSFWNSAIPADLLSVIIESPKVSAELPSLLLKEPYDASRDALYANCLRKNIGSGLADKIHSVLQNLSEEEWSDSLLGSPERMQLVQSFGEPFLGLQFENALLEKADSALRDNLEWSGITSPERLVSYLAPDSYDRFESRFVNAFATGTGPFSKSLASLGKLLSQGILRLGVERIHERIVESIPRADEAELTWLAAILQKSGGAGKAGQLRKAYKTGIKEVRATQALSKYRLEALDAFERMMGWSK